MIMTTRNDYQIHLAASGRAHVGGGYFNPVEDFDRVARTLVTDDATAGNGLPMVLNMGSDGAPTYYIATQYDRMTGMLREGELLFGAYFRGDYWFAVYLPDEERLLEFEEQVLSGLLVRRGFFAVAANEATRGLATEFSPDA